MEQLLQKIPVSGTVQTLIGIVAIILVTALAVTIIRTILFAFVNRIARKTSTTLDDRLLKATRSQVSLLVYVFGLAVLFNFIEVRYHEHIGTHLFRVVDGIIYSFGVIVVAVLLIRVVSTMLAWYTETVAAKTESTLDDEFIPLIDRTVKIVVYTLAILIILDRFEVDIKGMVAVLGIGSLAVALAAQDTLANMIGGFTIMIDRPFRVEDRVRLPDGQLVIVHQIGIRTTKFRTFDNTLVIVPNAELVKSTVHNITYPAPRVRVVVDVGVSYDSDIKKVREAMLDEARKNPLVLEKPDPYFALLNFGDSSVDVSLRCQVARPEDQWQVSCELREAVFERFRQENIEIPFPQRVVTMVKVRPERNES